MPNKDPKRIFEAIQKADPIVIVAHVNPDPDATGSQLGLKYAILDQYPEKTVLTMGKGPGFDEVSEETLAKALVIITDTSNSERVDDPRFQLGRQIARLDHHVRVEDFGDLDYVDDLAAAACEVEALLMKEEGWTISSKAAQHLMNGLYSDTQRFSIPTVTDKTFEAAAWLAKQGANPRVTCEYLYTSSYAEFCYNNKVKSQAMQKEHFLFSLMSQADYLSTGLPYEQAKNFVNGLGNIEGIEIWALFTQDNEGSYAASLRSRSIPIVHLAQEFGGGGHQCAAGIKKLSASQVYELIERCAKLSNLAN